MSRYVSFRDFDWWLLIFVLFICALGVTEIESATMQGLPHAAWLLLPALGIPAARLSFAATTAEPAAAAISADTVHDTINRYCVTCHNTRLKTADLMLDTADVPALPYTS